MPPQISALCEAFVTKLAMEGPLVCVLAEMVSQVAALAEGGRAAFVLATEVELDSLVVLALHLYHIMPLIGYTFEVFDVV